MADNPAEKTYKSPTVTSGAESPTTARELDFEDDTQDTSAPTVAPTSKNTTSPGPILEEAPPPKPPRPDPFADAEVTLKEMFPGMESKDLRAALVKHNGNVSKAIEELLGEHPPVEPPPRSAAEAALQRQMEEDERLARRLAEHDEAYGSRGDQGPRLPPRRPTNLQTNAQEEREHSFLEDDLPVIQENLRKGFNDTRTMLKGWITDVMKTIDGDDKDEYDNQGRPVQQRQNFGPSQSDQIYGIQRNAERSRPSGDRERYDADPHIIDDNFTALRLQDNDTPQNSRSNRPLANPDLFKPTPVAPQKGPVDEVEALYRQPTPTRQPSPGAGKSKKWQPLTSVAPNPEADDHDPFSLGDSDDEDTKTKDIKAEDTERLKKAAADSPVSPIEDKPLEAAERSGSTGVRNKEAEELLAKEGKP